MDPFTVSTTIAKPREEVFEYLADIANHAEFTDHYLVDWRLLREDPYGPGAGARFRVKAPLSRFSWADVTLAEVTAAVPDRRAGADRQVQPGPDARHLHAVTRRRRDHAVEYTLETEPVLLSDRLMETLGGRVWIRRQSAKALRRLRTILEEGRDRGRRPSVAAR